LKLQRYSKKSSRLSPNFQLISTNFNFGTNFRNKIPKKLC
jgi:hypothetical protein